MRILADFMVVIGAMMLTAAVGVMAAFAVAAVGHVSPRGAAVLWVVVLAAIAGSGLLSTGIMVHLRRHQE